MGVTITTVFNRTNAKNISGLYKVNIRVTINRKHCYLSIPDFPKLKKEHWHKGEIKKTHPYAYELNTLLQNKVRDLEGYVMRSLIEGTSVTWEGIKAIHEAESSRIDFIKFATEHIHKSRDIKYGTKRSYNTTITMLENFRSKIELRDIKRPFVEEFLQYQRDNRFC